MIWNVSFEADAANGAVPLAARIMIAERIIETTGGMIDAETLITETTTGTDGGMIGSKDKRWELPLGQLLRFPEDSILEYEALRKNPRHNIHNSPYRQVKRILFPASGARKSVLPLISPLLLEPIPR